MPFEIAPASLDEIRVVRHLVLRPHQRPKDIVYAHDADADALHLGAWVDGALVGIASIAREPPPGEDDATAWRVRGMATLPEHRGLGIGGDLLERCVAHAAAQGGSFVWLNGRVRATPFYERHGFVPRGAVFELPDIGPHLELRRRVVGAPRGRHRGLGEVRADTATGGASGPGDVLITPNGSRCTWWALSPVKRFWAVYRED